MRISKSSTITMTDIAAKAGVSQAAVSYVLNNKQNGRLVGEAARERILAAAAELGYQRNQIARSMVTGKSRVLGFIVHAPELQSAARMLAGVLDEADERDYFIKVIRWQPDQIEPVIKRCLELRLDGVIGLFMNQSTLERLHDGLTRSRVPVAVLENDFARPGTIRVLSDDAQAMGLVMEHLTGLGHHRIAFISSNPREEVNRSHEDAFRSLMKQHRLEIPESFIGYDYNLIEQAEVVTRELLNHHKGWPTAIVCYRDLTAMAVLRALHESGLRVPDDVSVIGHGDLSMARVAYPALTTVATPFYEMGRMTVRRLIDWIENNAVEDGTLADVVLEESLPARLIVRKSCAAVSPESTDN